MSPKSAHAHLRVCASATGAFLGVRDDAELVSLHNGDRVTSRGQFALIVSIHSALFVVQVGEVESSRTIAFDLGDIDFEG